MSAILAVPSVTDRRWRDVATGKINRPWSSLAMRILMTRILRETAQDSSMSNVQRCAGELQAFFVKNANIAQTDLAAILR